jgi:hypothetical protein
MTAKGGRTERLQIIVDTDELAVIDDFRFKSRMPSRAAAVRELLRRGLASAGAPPGGPVKIQVWVLPLPRIGAAACMVAVAGGGNGR